MSRIIRPNNVEAFRSPTLKPMMVGEAPHAVCIDTDIAPGIDPQKLQTSGGMDIGPLIAMLNQHSGMVHALCREVVALRSAIQEVLLRYPLEEEERAALSKTLAQRAALPQEILDAMAAAGGENPSA